MKLHSVVNLVFLTSHFRGNLVIANVSLGSGEGMTRTQKRNLSGSLLVLQVSLKRLSSQALMIKF